MREDPVDLLKEIDSKLGALISLNILDKTLSLKEKIGLLSMAGMSNSGISKILGISPIHVAKEKSLLKKKNG